MSDNINFEKCSECIMLIDIEYDSYHLTDNGFIICCGCNDVCECELE